MGTAHQEGQTLRKVRLGGREREGEIDVETVDEREDEDVCEENPTKTVVKDFLVSVIKLMSGLTKDTKVKVKKKKKDNADLLKTLADLLN